MNCKHCGAPMKLFRERDYYFCEHCQSYHFPDKDAEGLRILGANPQNIQCPLCEVTLNLMTFGDFFQGYQCPKCQGILFNRTTFREAIDFHRSRTKLPPEPVNRFDPAELDRIVYCSTCSRKMETFQYNGPGNIVIDTCHSCDLIWLDYGELKKVVDAPGKDRGVPRTTPAREDQDEKQEEKSGMELMLQGLQKIFFDK